MTQRLEPDLCVIGAGSGGLSVAAAAAQLGVRVVLIEKGRMGGDCLNYGCVPSKALLAAGRRAHAMRTAEPFGIANAQPRIDPQGVYDHVHSVIDAIAPNDSAERFTGLGVTVIRAAARFKDARTVVAGEHEIAARRFVIATGSRPAVPPIKGLDGVPYFTNETIFDNAEHIGHLVIIGGGPIGMELAQAHRRLGSEVTVVEVATPLAKDDPELTAVVLRQLEAEGIEILQGVRIEHLEATETGIRMYVTSAGALHSVNGTHLLLATGRRPNLEDLGLEEAGIKHERTGITVNRRLKTSNARVYAIGDVAGGLQFTHVANYHAGLVIRNALFRLPVNKNAAPIPWVTYTDPELAHVGLTEAQAREKHRTIRVLRWPFSDNDRAQTEGATEGFIKVVASKRGRILGASIVGEHAGELIQTWVLAMTKGLKIGDLTGPVLPYPTLGEINKRVAYTFYQRSLTSPAIRAIIRFLRQFG